MAIMNETTEGEMSTSTFASSSTSDPGYDSKIQLQCNRSLHNYSNINTFRIFGLVVPSDLENWVERDTAYWVFFYLMLVVFVVLFLLLGVFSILLLMKRHLAMRFKKVRTFIAIDLALMILGFSRAVFLIFNPWGQSGFCTHVACKIISRLIGALAFPSLTASYTLVFITLWLSARIQLGPSKFQRLKILIPLCFVHYAVAISFEIMGSIQVKNPFPVLILLLLCETVFSLWGFTVCLAFLFAGFRLLKTVEKSARESSIICKDSPGMSRHELIEKSRFANRKPAEIRQRSRSTMKLKHMLRDKHRRAIRKITLITYITAILGMIYSVFSIANLLLVVLSLFDGCPGYVIEKKQHPGLWLTFRYIFLTLEILLALLLTYSINDYKPVFEFMKKCVTSLCGLRRVNAEERSPTTPNLQNGSMLSSSDAFPSSPKPFQGMSLLAPTPKLPNMDPNEEKSDSSFEFPSDYPTPPASPTPQSRTNSDQNGIIVQYNESPVASRSPTKSILKSKSPLTVTFSSDVKESEPSNTTSSTPATTSQAQSDSTNETLAENMQTPTATPSNKNVPRHPSPLTVSFSLSDDESQKSKDVHT